MNSVEIKYFKYFAVYCFIAGAIYAILSLIPFLMPVMSLFIAPFFGVITPLIILIKKDGFYYEDNKIYALMGAFGGFCLCVSYLLIFAPLVLLIHFINKDYYAYGINVLYPFLVIMFFVMIAVVYSSTNSVAALITGFIHNYLKGKTNA